MVRAGEVRLSRTCINHAGQDTIISMKTRRKPFDRDEFAALYVKLQEEGWSPKICDKEVTIYDSEVPCGIPQDVNSEIFCMAALPEDLVRDNPTFMVRAKGDSMVDVGINNGDLLLVEYGRWAQEGDTVLAYVNGEVTVKTYFEASDGTRWLVPNNEKKDYKAIAIDDSADVKISGVVVASFKKSIRAAHRKCEKVVKLTRADKESEPEVSEQRVSNAIRTIAAAVNTKRQWYAVYRMLVNYSVVDDGDYEGFCERVEMEVPKHGHLPSVAELQRMAVMSFAKPVRQWAMDYAPVTGKRFKDYKNLAIETEKLLLQK